MTMSTPPARHAFAASAALWGSAFVLLALIVAQVSRLPSGRGGPTGVAMAAAMGDVARAGDYTVLTFNGGNDDVLAVLDGRGEELFLYRVKPVNQLEFISRDRLPDLFAAVRRAHK
jgi:hypothetical protein